MGRAEDTSLGRPPSPDKDGCSPFPPLVFFFGRWLRRLPSVSRGLKNTSLAIFLVPYSLAETRRGRGRVAVTQSRRPTRGEPAPPPSQSCIVRMRREPQCHRPSAENRSGGLWGPWVPTARGGEGGSRGGWGKRSLGGGRGPPGPVSQRR